MLPLWIGLSLVLFPSMACALVVLAVHFLLRFFVLHRMVRIFQEKPLFIVPRGQPVPDADDVRFTTEDGIDLAGCYLKTRTPRRGVILFGLEFGSNRWSCLSYCDQLLDEGYDIFSFELRGQGESKSHAGYEPLQWVTEYEVRDTRAAVRYLKNRPDADPDGIGFFGISKGAGAGLQVAVEDPYIRCCVTDGVFAAYTTAVPYMRQWYLIYRQSSTARLFPSWFYGWLGLVALKWIEKERACRFVHLDRCIHRLAPRPLFMLHGGADTYIKPEMARALFNRAGDPKELWLVENAKHNQAMQLHSSEYHRRVSAFFNAYLGKPQPQTAPQANHTPQDASATAVSR